MIRPLTFFCVFAMIHMANTKKEGIDWCDSRTWDSNSRYNALGQKIHHTYAYTGDTEACYFYVKGATDECNVAVRGDNRYFRFNLTCARKICAEFSDGTAFGVTLPSVTSKHEMEFLNTLQYHGFKCLVVLGMTKRPGQAQVDSWDDTRANGKQFLPDRWVDADKFDDVTVMETKLEKGYEWRSVPFINTHTLHVLCKQRKVAG